MCLHIMLQNGVLAVHVKTLKIIDSESKWYTSCHKQESISPCTNYCLSCVTMYMVTLALSSGPTQLFIACSSSPLPQYE